MSEVIVPLDDKYDPTPAWVLSRLKKLPRVVERLREVRAQILKTPKQFNMEEWISRYRLDEEAEPCGTVCCIGGWYAFKRAQRAPKMKSVGDALTFDLGWREGSTSVGNIKRLVYAFAWPEPFKTQFKNAVGKQEEARVAAKRITHFLRTGE